MIRINLLEETRTQVKAKGGGLALPKFEVAEQVPIFILAGGMAVALGAVLLWWTWLQSASARLDSAIKEEEKEKKRLEYVLKRNDELNLKKDDLTQKIKVISDLKQKQDQPVHIMDQVSRNLADFVWLDDLTFTGEGVINIHGKANSPPALSNFLRNLEESPYFLDVAMGNIVNNAQTGLTDFDLSMKFNPSGVRPQKEVSSTSPEAAKPPGKK